MNKKDACDLVIMFGFLATVFQLYSLCDLITCSDLSILNPIGVFSMILQTIVVLAFFASVTFMAYKLRDGLLTKERDALEKPKPHDKGVNILLYGIGAIAIGFIVFFFVMLVLPILLR